MHSRDIHKILRSRNPVAIGLMVVVLALAYFTQKDGGGAGDPARGVHAGRCVKVIDGDTVEVEDGAGAVFRVRLLGVDTMETFNEEKLAEQAARLGRSADNIRSLGERARARTRSLALNRPVEWEIPSDTPVRDPYQRILAYVRVDGRDLGEQLLAEGLAEPRRDRHPRQDRYRAAAKPLVVGTSLTH